MGLFDPFGLGFGLDDYDPTDAFSLGLSTSDPLQDQTPLAHHFAVGIAGGSLASLGGGGASSSQYGSLGHGYTPPPAHPLSQTPISNPYQYTFDEEGARQDAQRSASAALASGLLNSLLNHGQNVGDAFAAQRDTYNKSMSDAADSARQQALDNAKVQEWTIAQQDRRNQEQDRQEARQATEALRQQQAQKAQQDMQLAQAHAAMLSKWRDANPSDPAAALPDDDLAAVIRGRLINQDKADTPRQPFTVSPGSVVYDPSTGKPVYTNPRAESTDQGNKYLRVTPQQLHQSVEQYLDSTLGKGAKTATGMPPTPDQLATYAKARDAARPAAIQAVRDQYAQMGAVLPDEAGAGKPSPAPAAGKSAAAPSPATQALSTMVTKGLAAGHKAAEVRAFLKSKGHTDAEINQAFALASGG